MCLYLQRLGKAVTDKVQDARANARLKQMSYAGVSGLSMFGLNHDAVVYLIEQLYGASNCRNYKFLFNDYEAVELEEGTYWCCSSFSVYAGSRS